MGTQKDSEETKARLINAAGQLFAEKGFKAVTVRDIAAEAGTQISSLNYHFRSKEELYQAVVVAACVDDLISEEEQNELRKLKPAKALRLVIDEVVKELRTEDVNSWQNKLLARESRDPSPAFAKASEVYFKPQTDFMAELVSGVVGKSADDMEVRLAVTAMWSMFDTFFEYKHLVETTSPGLSEYMAQKDRFNTWLFDLVVQMAGKK